MRARGAVAVIILALGASAAPSCKPVQGTPLPSGPVNLCGTGIEDCSAYSIGETATGPRPSCTKRTPTVPQADTQARCDYGPPTFLYTVVVSVPDSSIYAPGRSFAFPFPPATTSSGAANAICKLPACLPLTDLTEVTGHYSITPAVATLLGLSVNGTTSIPVQARFIPFGPGTTVEVADVGLPLPDLYTTSGNFSATPNATPNVIWSTPIGDGSYTRIDYPEPPFDAFVPPYFSALKVAAGVTDDITLGTAADVTAEHATDALDDETGEFRTTTIVRRDGLDGWKVWIADHATQRRISTIKTLRGTNDTEVLHTVNFRQTAVPSLIDNVDLVITPPASYLAVPKLVSPIINGSSVGFRNVEFPILPAPVTFTGVVGGDGSDGTPLIGVPSNVAFASTGLLKIPDGDVTPIFDSTLQYATVVNTDDLGQFATVLPPGTYDVTVSPIEGTGFSKYRTSIDTNVGPHTLRPPMRTSVSGRAILADGRLLSYAMVRLQAASTTGVTPRPIQTLTDESGTFSFEADQGEYNLTVDPQLGTYFPRVVQPLSIMGNTQVVGDVVVPPGARFALTIRDPTSVANPIAHALVRVFAEYPGRGLPKVEIASETTDTAGYVEISLAPQTR